MAEHPFQISDFNKFCLADSLFIFFSSHVTQVMAQDIEERNTLMFPVVEWLKLVIDVLNQNLSSCKPITYLLKK